MNFSFRLTLYHGNLMRETLFLERELIAANCEKTFSPRNLTCRPKWSHSYVFWNFSLFLIYLRICERFNPPQKALYRFWMVQIYSEIPYRRSLFWLFFILFWGWGGGRGSVAVFKKVSLRAFISMTLRKKKFTQGSIYVNIMQVKKQVGN